MNQLYKGLNSSDLVEKREIWFGKLEKVFQGESPKKLFFMRGYEGKGASDPYQDPEKWVLEVLQDLEEHSAWAAEEECFRPLSLECGLFGVHFIDRMFGATVFYQDGQWYNHYLKTPIGELQKPKLEDDETWSLAKRIATAFLKSKVKLPLFGLPTIASTLNISMNLYGADIMVEWFENPEAVIHDLAIINELLCTVHRWYREQIPMEQLQSVISWERTQPHGYGQICGCSTHLLSPSMYEELFAPLDKELLSVYPNGGMIHLCGVHTQHIPVWRKMQSLKAVQLNDRATHDLEIYFKELREDQVIYMIPSEEMTVERALKITGGKRLVVQRGY